MAYAYLSYAHKTVYEIYTVCFYLCFGNLRGMK